MKKSVLFVLFALAVCLFLTTACSTAATQAPATAAPAVTEVTPTEVPYDCSKVGTPSSDGNLAYNQIAQLNCYNVTVLRDLMGDSFQATIHDLGVTWSDSPEFWMVTTTDGTKFYLNHLDMYQGEVDVNVTLVWDSDAKVYKIEGRNVPEIIIYPANTNPGP